MAYTGPVWTGNRLPASAALTANQANSVNWSAGSFPAGSTVFVVFVSEQNTITVTDAGWSLVASSSVNEGVAASAARISIWRKDTAYLGAGSEPQTNFVNDGVTSTGHVLLYGFGTSPDTVVDVVATNSAASTSTTAVSFPGLTTGGNNRLIIHLAGSSRDSSSAAFSGQSNANLTNLVERLDSGTTVNTGSTVAIVTGERELAAAIGSTTGTMASGAQARITVALKYATEDAGGTPSVGPANGSQAHAATAPTLVGRNSVSAASSGHAQAATSPALTAYGPATGITPGAGVHAHASTAPSLAAFSSVAPGNAQHGNASTSPTLTTDGPASAVTPAAAAHGQSAAEPTIGAASSIAPAGADHGQATTSPTLAAGGGGATPWTPAATDTLLWLDLNDAGSITEAGGLVTGLTDKSDSARTVTVTSGVQPAYETGAINGLPAAYFTSDRVEFAPQIGVGESVIAVTVYRGETQVLATLFGSNNTALVPIGASSSATNTEVFRGVAAPTIRKHGSAVTWANRGQANTALTNGENTLLVFSGLTVTDKLMYLGAGPFSYFFKGRIGEVLLLPGSAALEDVEKVEGYAAHKWGLQASLPADHPYKASPPTTGAETPSALPDSPTHAHAATSPTIGALSVVAPADAAQAHASTSPAIAARSSVAPADAAHGSAATSPTLTPHYVFAPASASQGQSATSPTVAAKSSVSPQAAAHAQNATSPTVSPGGSVAVASAAQAHASTSPTVAARSSIAPVSSAHGQSATSPALAARSQIQPGSAAHAHAAGSPVISTAGMVLPASGAHAQASTAPTLSVRSTVAPQSGLHGHASTAPTITPRASLSAQSASHTHTATSPTVAAASSLSPHSAAHQHLASSPVLAVRSAVSPSDALHALLSSSSIIVPYGPPEDFEVTADRALAGASADRDLDGPALPRSLAGLSASRTLTGPAAPRHLTDTARGRDL